MARMPVTSSVNSSTQSHCQSPSSLNLEVALICPDHLYTGATSPVHRHACLPVHMPMQPHRRGSRRAVTVHWSLQACILFVDKCTGLFVNRLAETGVQARFVFRRGCRPVCRQACRDRRAGLFCRQVCRPGCRQACRPVCRQSCRPVCRHACRPVCRQACRPVL